MFNLKFKVLIFSKIILCATTTLLGFPDMLFKCTILSRKAINLNVNAL